MKTPFEINQPILIADDDDNDVFLLKRVLKEARVMNPVHVVRDGEQAIRYLGAKGIYTDREQYPFPVLMFLNLQMPRKNGAEVLAWLQNQNDLPALKIIVSSGQTDPRLIKQAINLGAQSFLRKPPEKEKLLEIFRDMPELKLNPGPDGLQLYFGTFVASLIN